MCSMTSSWYSSAVILDSSSSSAICCLRRLPALSNNEMLDLGRNTSLANDARFEGGYIVPPVPRCYKGIMVIVIDGSSLYGSLISKLQIFVDRCTSAKSSLSLPSRLSVALPEEAQAHNVPIGEVI